MDHASPVVLVHGSWHGSWAWTLVVEELAGRGIPSVAVDLEGHGLRSRSPAARWVRPFDADAFATEPSPLSGVTASSSTALFLQQLRRISGDTPCLLVAHSMGGVVASAAAEQAPELVSGIVYVAGFAFGGPDAAAVAAPENQASMVPQQTVGDAAAVGALRLNPDDKVSRRSLRQVFYADVDPALAEAALSMISTDAPLGVVGEATVVTRERYGAIPHTYVLGTQDRAVPPPLARRLIDEIDAVSQRATVVVELTSSHSPFLSQPRAVADIIERARKAQLR